MSRKPKPQPVEKLLLYLACTTFIILVGAFFGSYLIPNETLKDFIQNITANVASTVFAFLVLYIFITSQNILPSVGDRTIPDEEFTDKIRLIVKIELQQLEKLQQVRESQILEIDRKIDRKIDELNQRTQEGREQVSDRIIQTIQKVTQQTIDSFTQGQKEAIQLFSGGKTVQALIKNANNVGHEDIDLYRFIGLKGGRENEKCDDPSIFRDPCFQNFDIRGRNINAISFFWSETSTDTSSKITAKVDKEDNFLTVSFESHSTGGTNIAIRPSYDTARFRDNKYRYLAFDM